jgi:hypothetical protein
MGDELGQRLGRSHWSIEDQRRIVLACPQLAVVTQSSGLPDVEGERIAKTCGGRGAESDAARLREHPKRKRNTHASRGQGPADRNPAIARIAYGAYVGNRRERSAGALSLNCAIKIGPVAAKAPTAAGAQSLACAREVAVNPSVEAVAQTVSAARQKLAPAIGPAWRRPANNGRCFAR